MTATGHAFDAVADMLATNNARRRRDAACAEALGMIEVLLENDDLPRYAVDLAQTVVDKFKAATKDMRRNAA